MKEKDLIGVTGLRRSGKDTIGACLANEGYNIVKFAGALKEMLRTYLSYVGVYEVMIEDLIEGQYKEVPLKQFCDKTTRYAMQTLGTEWGRDLIGNDIWVRAAMARAAQFDRVVISDVRFPNEVEAIRKAGGRIIHVMRPGIDVQAHASELLVASLYYDFLVLNDGTIDELNQKVLQLI
jgi:hypothetical protein